MCLSIPIVIGISAPIGMFTPAPDLIVFERVGCAVMPSIVDSHGRNLPDAIDLCPAPAVAQIG